MEQHGITDLAVLTSAEALGARAVVLVEGLSDKLAVRALAERRGRDIDAEGIAVLAMGGSKNTRRFLEVFGPAGLDVTLAGLCDAGEERDFKFALERAGIGADLSRGDMAALGFHVCVADLEDELIRALGVAAVEKVVEAQGEMAELLTFRRQPAWVGRRPEEQLRRRFLGTRSGRKYTSAPLLVQALDRDRVPPPLDLLLAGL